MRGTLITLTMASAALTAYAVAPCPWPVKYTSPDGKTTEVVIKGNRFAPVYYDLQGNALLPDDAGMLVPATGQQVLKAESMARRAASRSQSATGLHERFLPATGSPDVCVILVEFSDVKFTVPSPHDYFNRWLNDENFTSDGNTGSVREYFKAQSSGRFSPNFRLYGPVTLSRTRSYYASTSSAYKMVHDACGALDSQVDFSGFDLDGDGNVDNVYIIYAGQGANYGASNAPWAHNSNCETGLFTKKTVDGKLLYHYACASEQGYTVGEPDGIGTFIHEFGHVLGFPDFYNTNETGDDTPFFWSIMDRGNYLGYGKTPCGYSAYERHAQGWLEYTELSSAQTVDLEPMTDNNYALTIATGREGDFYILENRPAKGWDCGLYGGGMLIWHIDASDATALSNNPNNDSSHLRVRLVRADNDDSGASVWGDAWTSGDFTGSTTPAMVRWQASTGSATVPVDKPVTNITQSGDMITFDYCGGSVDTRVDYAHFDGISAANRASRGVSSLILTASNGKSLTVQGPGGSTGRPIYVDRTSQQLTVRPGDVISVSGSAGSTEWMHSYIYIDFDGNRCFDADADNTGVHKELVAHTGYNISAKPDGSDTADPTVKSDNTPVNNGNFLIVPTFTIPAGTADGTYRLRFKVDWNNNDPYGRSELTLSGHQKGNFIDVNGGSIIDLTLKVEAATAIDDIAADDNAGNVEYYNLMGVRIHAEDVTPGVYIVRRGNKVSKTIVR